MTRREISLICFVAGLLCTSIWNLAQAQPQSQHGFQKFKDPIVKHATRACYFPPGGWVIIDCSNALAATSAKLNAYSRYVIQCGVDSRIATGDAVTDSADTSDGYLPAGAWLEFMTGGGGTDQVRYVSCLNIGSDDDCRILECI